MNPKFQNMFYRKWSTLFFLCFVHSLVGYAQQEVTTSYYNNDSEKFGVFHGGLEQFNIVLNGKVKSMMEVSYYAHISCDTVPSTVEIIDYSAPLHGYVTSLLCKSDTMIYHFNNDLSLKMIKNIDFYVDEFGKSRHYESTYLFQNGDLISKKSTRNGVENDETTYAYQYDSNNNLILKTENNSYSTTIYSFEYDDHNHLLKKRGYKYDNEIKEFDDKEFQYDTLGNMISKTWNNNKRKDIYVYDNRGNKIEEGSCGTNNQYHPSQGFVYDDNNRLIKNFTIGDWRPHNSDIYYQYDEYGQEIEVKNYYIYNQKDTVLGYHYIYEYNSYGQKTREEALVGDLLQIHGRYKVIATTYDEHQNMTQQECYNSENQIGFIIRHVYTYDQYGNWIKMEEFEGKNENELKKTNITERIFEYY